MQVLNYQGRGTSPAPGSPFEFLALTRPPDRSMLRMKSGISLRVKAYLQVGRNHAKQRSITCFRYR